MTIIHKIVQQFEARIKILNYSRVGMQRKKRFVKLWYQYKDFKLLKPK